MAQKRHRVQETFEDERLDRFRAGAQEFRVRHFFFAFRFYGIKDKLRALNVRPKYRNADYLTTPFKESVCADSAVEGPDFQQILVCIGGEIDVSVGLIQFRAKGLKVVILFMSLYLGRDPRLDEFGK